MRLDVQSTVPTAAPDKLSAGVAGVIPTRQGLTLRLKAKPSAVAPISVRPWVWLGGRWEPVRGDGKTGVGPDPVTCDKNVLGGFATGIYLPGGMACAFCLVAESGAATDVETADLDEYFVR